MSGLPHNLKLLVIPLIALFLLVSCVEETVEDTEEAVTEELLLDSPAAVGAVRGGLPFVLPKPRHSNADELPIFRETVEE